MVGPAAAAVGDLRVCPRPKRFAFARPSIRLELSTLPVRLDVQDPRRAPLKLGTRFVAWMRSEACDAVPSASCPVGVVRRAEEEIACAGDSKMLLSQAEKAAA